MNPFLKQVAKFLYSNYADQMNQLTLVFPSRRSGVFFSAYLNELIEKPLLGPDILTISEWTGRLSEMQNADSIDLIFRLHRIFTEELGSLESPDEFYYWGEILLNDFNDLDKYMLDADDVFQNLTDLKDVESKFEYLGAEQRKFLEQFWRNMQNASGVVNKEKFLQLWEKLPVIYHRFREELIRLKIGYSGLIARNLILNLKNGNINSTEQLVFIGFNALNKCEQSIFKYFKDKNQALFFWDYDPAFLDDSDHEAGLFIRKNILQFPMPESYEADSEELMKQPKISIVSVSGQIAQTQLLNQIKFNRDKNRKAHFDDAALILADENLLIPVVSAVGYTNQLINITMGYPLKNTPVYSLLLLIIDLQKNYKKVGAADTFYYKQVLAILNHQMVTGDLTREIVHLIHSQNKIYVSEDDLNKSDLLKVVFSRQTKWQDCVVYLKRIIQILASENSQNENEIHLENEYLYQVFLALQRLEDSLTKYQTTNISIGLFFRLLKQYLSRITIPFEGEPLSGLQIMGVLETRNLDFEKIVIFSVNEGNLPRLVSEHSFIPYHLRKAFGLPAYEESDAMYAYYFYRLLHRAREVVLVYDSSGNGLNVGEMSRYLFQMRYDSELKTDWYHLNFNFKAPSIEPLAIKASPRHQQILLDRYTSRRLSPSALNTYLDCKLKFYFRHIAAVRETDELTEEVDPRLFGNLFHFSAELIYRSFKGKVITKDLLDRTRSNKKLISEVVHKAFIREYFKDERMVAIDLSGKNRLIAENLQTYLEQMLLNDVKFCPFSIIGLEADYNASFDIELDGKTYPIKLGGIVDRLDRIEEGTRVVDYKTGRNLLLNYRSIDDLFDRDKHKRPKEIFQTFIYSEIIMRNEETPLLPTIYKIDEFFQSDFHPEIMTNGKKVIYQQEREPFNEKLSDLLSEMFSSENCYEQTEDLNKCRSCPYNKICQRD